MKMVKSLLLGAAAGVVAMTGAQAADLPVKAKPVQYVKICSLYGAGFYYIPGTDTCIKVGGWVRMQMGYGYNGNTTNGPLTGNVNNRSTTDFNTRNRGYITADARSQTEYGTLRAYIAVGLSGDNATNSTSTSATNITAGIGSASAFNANRAFIQLAGFTFGRAQSFYDFMGYSALSYHGGANWTPAGADTGDGGQQVFAYTAQFGNGLSATISLEESRNGAVAQVASAVAFAAASATSGRVGNKWPDVVGNLRIDQAWGSAQVAGAIHNASAEYYTAAGPASGHPGNEIGYAFSAGLRLNAPMIGKGDYFAAQFNWTEGAIRYATAGTSYGKTSGGESGFGLLSDGVYGATGDVQLTSAWSVGAAFEHNWNPKWKTSIYGGYTEVDYNDAATALFAAFTAGANPDFSIWQVGTRTAWAPVPNLEVGVDVIYSKLNSAFSGVAATSMDQDAWAAQLRIQRNFYP
ncbi:MAG: porin [Betaproteobacteria bacterium]|nr:porin [Betaproteobacteria bacterium]